MTKDAERVPPTLPEAVEQAIKEVVFAAHDTGVSHGTSEKCVRFEGEQVAALRAAILSYGAARERQGIERAKVELQLCAEDGVSATNNDQCRIETEILCLAYDMLRALPVEGETK